MNRARHAVIFVALAAALLGHGAARAVPAPVHESGAGPREASAPAGAVTVSTFDELARLVADPGGPREIWLRAGTYRGDLEIKRALAIHGETGAVLEGTGATSVVVIGANDVTVDNLVVRHSGRRSTTEDAGIKATGERIRVSGTRVEDTLFGVSYAACHFCLLERVSVHGSNDPSELRGDGIKLWESNDSIVRRCEVDHARDVVVWYTRRALVEENVVKDGRYGTHFMYAHDSVARKNRIEGNVVGIFVMYSLRLVIEDNVLAGARGAAGMGLGFKESDSIDVHGNWIVANTSGTYLDYSPRTPEQPVVFRGNVFALNDVALRLHSVERGAVFHGNDFRNDAQTIEVDGGGDALACDVRGNHFSDYEGYDLDGDGVGDVPHRVDALSSELADEHPALKILHGSAAMQIIDAVAHAVPVLDRRTLLVDRAPLFRSPEIAQP